MHLATIVAGTREIISMRLIAGIIAITTAASPVVAAEPVPVGAFQSVQLRGGGEVVVRHGPVQRVTITEGSRAVTRFEVASRDRKLTISACEERCPRNYKLRVEIVTPALAGLSIEGGGRLSAAGGFPQQRSLGLAILGGGEIDARSVRAANVGASISGGGVINTHAVGQLGANINGGGAVRYWGDPRTAVNINGGGSVTRGTGR